MSKEIPPCSNPHCPKSDVVIDREEPGRFTTLWCRTCNGTQIITQDNYRRGIRQEVLRRRREGQSGLPRDQRIFPMHPRGG